MPTIDPGFTIVLRCLEDGCGLYTSFVVASPEAVPDWADMRCEHCGTVGGSWDGMAGRVAERRRFRHRPATTTA
jgi:hypothetical protein